MNLVDAVRNKPWLGWVLFLTTVGLVFLLGLLTHSIVERRSETKLLYQMVKEIPEDETRNEVWGANFPREFESYKNTLDTTFKSAFGGGAMRDALEEDPRLVILWAGYGFSKDYNQGRGHYWAVKDIRNTLRTGAPRDANDGPMPGTCWTCKSTDVERLMKKEGIAEFYKATWAKWGTEINNPIGCKDCHDSKTMNLRISRPALIEAYQRMGKDISKATHQEMRSLVCAQCHVEYYFAGKEKYLTFPWDKGLAVENMEEYYDEVNHVDWVHTLSRAPMLKAQHPDWEIFMTGTHAKRGISCADCHMPYKSEGGTKFTDHKIQSPLNNIANACQVCHRESESSLISYVVSRQSKIDEIKLRVEDALVRAHFEAKAAWDSGATEKEMARILNSIRNAQWRWDYAAASHGGSFHSTVEMARVLGSALESAYQARVELATLLASRGVTQPIGLPDISSKAKAQRVIGLPMDKMEKDKIEFLRSTVKDWVKAAQSRGDKVNLKE